LCVDYKEALNCGIFIKSFFAIIIMIMNELSEIFSALKDCYDKKLLHKKIASISLNSRNNLCYNTFMILLNDVVSIYKEITIDNVVSLNFYENPSFFCTLFVFKNGILTPWLSLKLSSIKNSGLGLFSSQNFKKNEFITCYLGEVNENPSDEEYTFKKINGNPVKSASGLLKDNWFGHQIQHGSGNQVNFTITSGYEIKAKKEELFMDYNRSLFCRKCKAEKDFYDGCTKKSKKCNLCRNVCLKFKKCTDCEAYFICLLCYDKSQIKFKKNTDYV
jgi:hypothetical protein